MRIMRIIDGKCPRTFLQVFLAIFFCLLFSRTLCARGYFVANHGNDKNPGTKSKPWKTLTKASKFSFRKGDDLFLNRGDVFENHYLTIRWEGTPSNPATVGAYGKGDRPIVKFDSIPEKPASRMGISAGGTCKHLIVENLELKHVGLSLGGTESKDYTVRNVKVSDTSGAGIILKHVDGYLVEHCEVLRAGNCGIAVWGSDPPLATNGIIRNNTVGYLRSNDGIVIHASSKGGTVGPNHLILNNVSHHNPEQGYDVTTGSYVFLQGNISYDNEGGAITVGHSAHHVLIDQHASRHEGNWTFAIGFTGSGSEVEHNRYGTVRRSLIVNPTTYGIHAYNKARDIALVNNTIVYGGELMKNRPMIGISDSVTGVTIRNNILLSTNNTPGSFIGYRNGRTPKNTQSDIDFNCYFRADKEQKLFCGMSFRDWQSSEKLDRHGKYIDPRLNDLAAKDYTLSKHSPAIDAGGPWTETVGSGKGTQVTVKVASLFFDGFQLMEGDSIYIGKNQPVTVKHVDYENNILTVSKSIRWKVGDGVGLPYEGSAPDLGAFETGAAGPASGIK